MLLSRNSGDKDTAFLLIDKHFASFLRIPFRIAEQNREQGACSHCKRIIEIADDTDGGDAGKSRCNQHLRSIRDNPLYQAGERIENTGGLSPVEMELLGNIPGYRSCGDDGDGVVGGTQVGDTYQGGDAQFCAPLAVDVAGKFPDNKVNAAVIADSFQHTACQQGDDDEFPHSCYSGSHSSEPVEDSEASGSDADDSGRQYTYN